MGGGILIQTDTTHKAGRTSRVRGAPRRSLRRRHIVSRQAYIWPAQIRAGLLAKDSIALRLAYDPEPPPLLRPHNEPHQPDEHVRSTRRVDEIVAPCAVPEELP